jgi:hypothetical protein
MVGAASLAKPAGEVFGLLRGLKPRDRDPCLVITGRGLKRQERGLPYPAESLRVQIVELHEMHLIARRPDDDVVLPRLPLREIASEVNS